MKQILVPTDLSQDAAPGIRLAIQWSRQQKVKLLFTYVLYIPRLTQWNDEQYSKFAATERTEWERKLERTVTDMYARLEIKDGLYECRVIEGAITEPTLLDYCRHHPDIDLICMGTHGAAGIQKLFGTHAGNILTGAGIPVVVVPNGYQMRPLTSVLYATDLLHYKKELKQIADLAGSLEASLDILYMIEAGDQAPNKDIFEKILNEEFHYPVRIHFPIRDKTRSMAANLKIQIEALKPSMAALFTNQDRTILEKLFLSSTTERMAFDTPVPLIVYPKGK